MIYDKDNRCPECRAHFGDPCDPDCTLGGDNRPDAPTALVWTPDPDDGGIYDAPSTRRVPTGCTYAHYRVCPNATGEFWTNLSAFNANGVWNADKSYPVGTYRTVEDAKKGAQLHEDAAPVRVTADGCLDRARKALADYRAAIDEWTPDGDARALEHAADLADAFEAVDAIPSLQNANVVQTPTTKWEPWTDGHAVGFKATHTDGRVRYVYLNPSQDDPEDEDDVPTVFLYEDAHGDVHDGMTVCYLSPFEPDSD